MACRSSSVPTNTPPLRTPGWKVQAISDCHTYPKLMDVGMVEEGWQGEGRGACTSSSKTHTQRSWCTLDTTEVQKKLEDIPWLFGGSVRPSEVEGRCVQGAPLARAWAALDVAAHLMWRRQCLWLTSHRTECSCSTVRLQRSAAALKGACPCGCGCLCPVETGAPRPQCREVRTCSLAAASRSARS